MSYIFIGPRWCVTHLHYGDVKMAAMASQITGVSIVYSTFCQGVDKKQNIKAPRH